MTTPATTISGGGGDRTDSPKGRTYTWKGETFASVTTILSGGVPKPALPSWAARSVAEYVLELADARQLGRLVTGDRETALKTLKGAPWSRREQAADFGSAVHDLLERYQLGTLDETFTPSDPRAAGYVAGYRRFLSDCHPEYVAVEAQVYNRSGGYAGTLDAIVTLHGSTYVLDYKTGAGVYPEAALQLAAYRYAEFLGLPDGTEHPMPHTDGALVLHLMDGEYRLLRADAGLATFETFQVVQAIHRWLQGPARECLSPYPTLRPMLDHGDDDLPF